MSTCAPNSLRGRHTGRVVWPVCAVVLGITMLDCADRPKTQRSESGSSTASVQRDSSLPKSPPRLICGRDESGWLITQDSVGPISTGVTFERLRRLCPEGRDSFIEPDMYVGFRVPQFVPPLWVDALPTETLPRPSGRVALIWIRSPVLRTPEGLGVGSTLSQIRSAFRGTRVLLDNERGIMAVSPSRSGVWYILPDARLAMARGPWHPDSGVAAEELPGSLRVGEIGVMCDALRHPW